MALDKVEEAEEVTALAGQALRDALAKEANLRCDVEELDRQMGTYRSLMQDLEWKIAAESQGP